MWWGGLASLVGGVVSSFAGFRAYQPVLLAAGLLAWGANVLLGGELVVGREPRLFTARGQVVRGEVKIRAGLCDLAIGDCPIDRVASLRHGPMGQPSFGIKDSVARLALRQPAIPNITQWQAGLASNILWDVEARSSLGDLSLNFTSLRLERVYVQTWAGRVTLLCPLRGYAEIRIRSGIGDIEIHIPEEVGAHFEIKHGELGRVWIDNPRVLVGEPGEYLTSGFKSAGTRVRMQIVAGAGTVTIS